MLGGGCGLGALLYIFLGWVLCVGLGGGGAWLGGLVKHMRTRLLFLYYDSALRTAFNSNL
ncbi:hypothetical protein BDZ94DRAFT_1244455 [Collybia nuda]|uniref:Transmembrane protein n=1 Tax=Collybia nuda TaxID=64659 RepID=A0A9P6CQW7_9AGAR|nr:hypothetical protein BDZ94DRAFT_1244455 [Collybia nuda]